MPSLAHVGQVEAHTHLLVCSERDLDFPITDRCLAKPWQPTNNIDALSMLPLAFYSTSRASGVHIFHLTHRCQATQIAFEESRFWIWS